MIAAYLDTSYTKPYARTLFPTKLNAMFPRGTRGDEVGDGCWEKEGPSFSLF